MIFKAPHLPLNLTLAFSMGITGLLALGACSHHGASKQEIIANGQFWQRVHTAEAIYMRGPKAQQLLNRDIARCVTELRELERLGMLKHIIPTNPQGRVLDPDQLNVENEDTPERDQFLFAEHSDFADFETCMISKGWERVKYVPYDVAYDASKTYIDTHVHLSKIDDDNTYRREYGDKDYVGLND